MGNTQPMYCTMAYWMSRLSLNELLGGSQPRKCLRRARIVVVWKEALVSAVKSTGKGASGSCREAGRERAMLVDYTPRLNHCCSMNNMGKSCRIEGR